MKEGWEYKKIDDISTIVGRIGFRGYTKNDLVSKPELGAITLSPSNIINGELSFEKCSYISLKKYEESPEIMLAEGDVVLVKTASIGKCSIVRSLPHKATLNPQFVVFKNIKIDNEYFNYYIKSPYFQKSLKTIVGGVAIPTLSQKKLGQLEIYFPTSYDEQRRIVSYLDSSFKLIDEIKNKALKSLTEAKALFQSALAEAMEPKEGWEEKTLGECCDKINGLWKGKKPPFIYVGVIRNANFTKKMTLDFSNIEYLDVEVKQYNSRKLKRGDLIIEKSGGSEKQPVGRAVLFLKGDGEYSFSNFTSVLRIKNNEELNYYFLYYFLLYIYQRGDTKTMQKATTGIHNIEFEKYLNIKIPIMSLNEQRRIVSYLEKRSSKVRAIADKSQKMVEECDALKQARVRDVFE